MFTLKESTTSILARYDTFADFYESTVSDLLTAPPDTEVLRLVGPVAGLRLLDLACGHGRFARAFSRRGAEVVAIDLSLALLDKARGFEHEEGLGIRYVHADATTSHTLAGETFDIVVCAFGLSDIDNLDGALTTVSRVLHSGGSFVFSLLHPCFPGWREEGSSSWEPGQGYYREGWWLSMAPASTLRNRVGSNHRMLSTYLNAFIHHGLTPEEFAEPAFPAEWAAMSPEKDPVPIFLAGRCRRQ